MQKIIDLYQQIADLTLSHCSRTCQTIGSCCSLEYCLFTIQYAKEEYGIELPPTENIKIPLLDCNGKCTAPPYCRPLCSVHSCQIAAVGLFRGEPELTTKYFDIREELEDLEALRILSKE